VRPSRLGDRLVRSFDSAKRTDCCRGFWTCVSLQTTRMSFVVVVVALGFLNMKALFWQSKFVYRNSKKKIKPGSEEKSDGHLAPAASEESDHCAILGVTESRRVIINIGATSSLMSA
jgi:hypothetical protein